jgi:small basic protein (TIGR04137 family)
MVQAPPASRVEADTNPFRKTMSQHNSLRASSTSGVKRNVLKRYERVEILKKRGQWKDGDRVTGLRKTKPME